MTSSQQLSKSERITSKKLIERLFKGGGAKSMSAFPLRVVFMTEDADAHEPLAKMMVSVPKRYFKRAVKRNHVKRLVREAYRRNKQVLIDTLEAEEQRKALSLCCIWTDGNLRSYEEVERKIANLRLTRFSMACHPAHTVLSGVHHAIYTPFVPLHTNLLRVRPSGTAEAWLLQRYGTRRMAHPPLQPVGRLRLRPRTLTSHQQPLPINSPSQPSPSGRA